jgi:sulfur transfer protein SufE
MALGKKLETLSEKQLKEKEKFWGCDSSVRAPAVKY